MIRCMTRCMILLLFFGMVSSSDAQTGTQTCEQLESKAGQVTATLPLVADQLGALGTMRRTGFQGIRQCPDSASLWYAAVRSAELLGIPSGFAAPATLSSLVAEAVRHVPTSAPIATVAARVTNSPDQARKAVALDSHYRPAQRALAVALAHAGQVQEALRLCQTAHPTKEDELARARILSAAGRTAEAVAASRKALASRSFDLTEPTPAEFLDRDAHELLGFALLKSGHNLEADKALRIAASEGSVAAQQQLNRSK